MNQRLQRLLKLHRLMDQASGDEGGKSSGGGGTGDGGGDGGQDGKGEGEGGKSTGDKGGDGGSGDGGTGDGGGDGGAGDGDGKAKLSDNEAKLLRESMERKAKIKELNDQLAKFNGIDPEAARKALNAEAARQQAELEARGEFDAVKKQMVESHTAELSQRDQQLADKDTEIGALKARIADMTVGADFTGSKFIADDLALTPRKARTVYGAHFDYSEEHGRVVGYDKPAGAKDRAPLVDGKGEPLAFDAALRKLVEADPDRDDILKSKTKPGAGSSTSAVKPVQTQGEEVRGVGRIAASLKAQTQK